MFTLQNQHIKTGKLLTNQNNNCFGDLSFVQRRYEGLFQQA